MYMSSQELSGPRTGWGGGGEVKCSKIVHSAVNLNHKTYLKSTGNCKVHKGMLRYIKAIPMSFLLGKGGEFPLHTTGLQACLSL